MKAQPLRIVDGHDPASGNRFGKFASRVIDGGPVGDEECVPVQPSQRYVVRSFIFMHWVVVQHKKSGACEWLVGPLLSRRRAEHIAAELQRAQARGIMDVFR